MSKKVRSMSEYELGQYKTTKKSSTKHSRYFSEVRQAGNLFNYDINKIDESINEYSVIDRVECDKFENDNPFDNENVESFRNLKFNESSSFESGNITNNLHLNKETPKEENLLKSSNSGNLSKRINLLKPSRFTSKIGVLNKNSMLRNYEQKTEKTGGRKINKPRRVSKFNEILNSRSAEKDLDFLDKIENEEKENCENDYDANELFCKIKLEEFNCAFFTLISIASGMIYHDLNTYGQKFYSIYKNKSEFYNMSINISSILVTIGVVMFIISSVFRYILLIKLNQATGDLTKRHNFFSPNYFISFLLETILALLHPNLAFHDLKTTTDESWFLKSVTYNLNDFFQLLLLLRVYVIFRFFIVINKYFNSRSSRIAKMIGSKLSRIFAVRCIIVVYPYKFLLVTGSILSLTLALMLRIVEGPIYDIDKTARDSNNDYRYLQNCIWNIFVTMTTVGYGDYYPLTNLGRLINILAALTGTTIISLMIISLQNSLEFTTPERKAYEAKEKLDFRKKLETKAGIFFKTSFEYLKIKTKYKMSINNPKINRKNMLELKKQAQMSLYKRIESQKEFKYYLHQFRNCYEMTSESDIVKDKLEYLQQVVCKVSDSGSNIDESLVEINLLLENIQNKKLEKFKKKSSLSGGSNTVPNSRKNSDDNNEEDHI